RREGTFLGGPEARTKGGGRSAGKLDARRTVLGAACKPGRVRASRPCNSLLPSRAARTSVGHRAGVRPELRGAVRQVLHPQLQAGQVPAGKGARARVVQGAVV